MESIRGLYRVRAEEGVDIESMVDGEAQGSWFGQSDGIVWLGRAVEVQSTRLSSEEGLHGGVFIFSNQTVVTQSRSLCGFNVAECGDEQRQYSSPSLSSIMKPQYLCERAFSRCNESPMIREPVLGPKEGYFPGWQAYIQFVRNFSRPSICSTQVSTSMKTSWLWGLYST